MPDLDLSSIGKKTSERIHKYNWRDVVLYAIGIGAQPEELPFVYERVQGGLKVFPSYACIAAGPGWPRFGTIDPTRFVHGEQLIRLHQPFASSGEITVQGEVTSIYDKGKSAVINLKISGRTKEGEPIFDNEGAFVYFGAGNFGGDRGPKAENLAPPEGKEPDFSISYKTNRNQAALYRLTGDLNPLHLDPRIAEMGGRFKGPILHGLCSYGYATRALVYTICDGEVSRLKEFKARFTSEVYPGETLTTEGWKTNGRYIVQVKTDRGPIVLGNAYAIVE